MTLKLEPPRQQKQHLQNALCQEGRGKYESLEKARERGFGGSHCRGRGCRACRVRRLHADADWSRTPGCLRGQGRSFGLIWKGVETTAVL